MSDHKREIDGPEFVRLITANQKRIYSYILTLVPNISDAEDILQETTAFMWERKGDFEPGTDFVAWGARIAYFKVLDHRKKIRKNLRLINDKQFDNFSEKALEQSKDFEAMRYKLKKCVQELSEPDRLLINMRYSICIGVKEISSRINKSVRSVYLALSRIHNLLLYCIKRNEF